MSHSPSCCCFKPVCTCFFCGQFNPKMKILASFTHPPIAPILCDFLSSVEHKEDKMKNFAIIDFHSTFFVVPILWMFFQDSSEYRALCSTDERNS